MSLAIADRRPRAGLFAEGRYVVADPAAPMRPRVPDPAFQFVLEQACRAKAQYEFLLRREDEYLRMRFEALAAAWRPDVAAVSSVTDAAMHPAYQQIIGMGPAVVALVLEELERVPDHWFWALKAITGEDPTVPEQRGRLGEMRRAWLDWGRKKGFLR